MGTYTTNYQLFMPSIGEQGWGELVNGNFTTIDATMKGLDTRMGTAETNITSLTTRMGTAETTITSNKSRIGTLETETDAFDSRITALENGDIEYISGKLNVSTFSENSSNLKIAEFVTSIVSGRYTKATSGWLTWAASTTITPDEVSGTYCNTSIVHVALTETEAKGFSNSVCTITISTTNMSNNARSCTIKVTRTSDNTVVLNKTLSISGGASGSASFTRNLGETYTITASGLKAYNADGSAHSDNYKISTADSAIYVA